MDDGIEQACLFGWDPMPWKGRRGRPPHVPTPENMNRVKLLLGLEWTNERIANALGITQPTLRKHYLSALKCRAMARDALQARIAERLFEQVEKGNVGAMKRLESKLEDQDRARAISRAGRSVADGHDEDEAESLPPAPRGKKETAVATAEAAIARDPLLGGAQGQLIN